MVRGPPNKKEALSLFLDGSDERPATKFWYPLQVGCFVGAPAVFTFPNVYFYHFVVLLSFDDFIIAKPVLSVNCFFNY